MRLIFKKEAFLFFAAAILSVAVVGCGKNQFGGYFQESFSVTPKCGVTDKRISFRNDNNQTMAVEGIAFTAGSNAEAHFSIQGLKVGSDPEMEISVSGGISEVEIPAGAIYSLRVRYNPKKESQGETHVALIDIAYSDPAGIVQVEVSGTSEGEADCPEIEEGGPVGLDGPIQIAITQIVAATNQVTEPLSSDNGVTAFVPVDLPATLSVTAGSIDFPQITLADDFILPMPNPDIYDTLGSLVLSPTDITTKEPISGIYDASTGSVSLSDMEIDLNNLESEVNMSVDLLTTGAVNYRPIIPKIVDNEKAGFLVIGDEIVGTPIQADGSLTLVGIAFVYEAVGLLDPANRNTMAVQLKATISCTDETISCDFGGEESESESE